jgi:hypothetical protein
MKVEIPILTLEEYGLLNYMLGRLYEFQPENMRNLAQKIFCEARPSMEPELELELELYDLVKKPPNLTPTTLAQEVLRSPRRRGRHPSKRAGGASGGRERVF